jgi:peptidoglycan/xylan/chitin deacetylase (PgdA/CDA1 family)
VVITFDDGYADNAGDARAILAANGLPATFFVSPGPMGERTEAWWDRLEQMLFGAEPAVTSIDITIAGRAFWGDLRTPAARARVHMALYWRLRPLRPAAIASVLDDLQYQLAVETHARDSHRWMNLDELHALAGTAGVEVGAHTITHPLLASLPIPEQRMEIEGSRTRLEGMLNKRVDLFSYPYGGNGTFDSITAGLVRDAGFSIACTTAGGLARPEDDRFALPRNLVGDWDGRTFEQWLERQMAA